MLYDFTNAYIIFLRMLSDAGKPVWNPRNVTLEEQGLFQNLVSGKIPVEKKLALELELIRLNPVNIDYAKLLLQDFSSVKGVPQLAQFICMSRK